MSAAREWTKRVEPDIHIYLLTCLFEANRHSGQPNLIERPFCGRYPAGYPGSFDCSSVLIGTKPMVDLDQGAARDMG
jgi:hypothetical protein